MTPLELLAEVKTEFEVLLLQEDALLIALLKRSLRTYHDSIGFQKTLVLPAEHFIDGIEIPDDFEGLLTAYDQQQQPVPVIRHNNVLIFEFNKRAFGELTVIYFSDFMEWDLANDHFPVNTKLSLVHSHLHGLITLANNERLRGMHQAAELPADHLPMDADIRGRLTELEAVMKEHPPFLIAAQLAT